MANKIGQFSKLTGPLKGLKYSLQVEFIEDRAMPFSTVNKN